MRVTPGASSAPSAPAVGSPPQPWLPRHGRRDAAEAAGGALARKAWFACLVYQRVRYTLRHPVSRLPGYTFRYDAALRIAKRCLNPLDLLREIPSLNPMG